MAVPSGLKAGRTAEAGPQDDLTVLPAGGDAGGEGQGETGATVEPGAAGKESQVLPGGATGADQPEAQSPLATEKQPAAEQQPALEEQPKVKATRMSPASAPDASREMVPLKGAASRLDGQERRPADPLAFANEV